MSKSGQILLSEKSSKRENRVAGFEADMACSLHTLLYRISCVME
jgi:hypothetical protein